MFEEAISIISIWASMNSWLTPTVLFLLLNLMIGTIALTSGFTSHKPNHHNNLHEHTLHFHQQSQIQPQLTRSASVLQRIKSINFSNFYSQSPISYFQNQNPVPQPQSEPIPVPKSELELELTPSTTSSSSSSEEDDETPTLDEIYSRIKQGNTNLHYGRQNSDTKPSNGEIPTKLPQKMKKSASDKSSFNHFQFQDSVPVNNPKTHVETVDEEFEEIGVDAKADDFINKFREQLQLQRKDSILRYKEMVSRTSAK
ncbi:unnamed protein product [Amaranthus hypochondriacus]